MLPAAQIDGEEIPAGDRYTDRRRAARAAARSSRASTSIRSTDRSGGPTVVTDVSSVRAGADSLDAVRRADVVGVRGSCTSSSPSACTFARCCSPSLLAARAGRRTSPAVATESPSPRLTRARTRRAGIERATEASARPRRRCSTRSRALHRRRWPVAAVECFADDERRRPRPRARDELPEPRRDGCSRMLAGGTDRRGVAIARRAARRALKVGIAECDQFVAAVTRGAVVRGDAARDRACSSATRPRSSGRCRRLGLPDDAAARMAEVCGQSLERAAAAGRRRRLHALSLIWANLRASNRRSSHG